MSVATGMNNSPQLKPLPTIAVEGLTGCAGEQLVILENLDVLLPRVRVMRFPFAQTKMQEGKVDITFVEGSVSQPHDLEKLKRFARTAVGWWP